MSTITTAPPNLVQTLLERTYQISDDPQSLYALLSQHADQLPHLPEEIRHWTSEKFRSKNLAVSRALAHLLLKFSNLIQAWDPLSPGLALEIAITAHQQALHVIQPEAFPDEATHLQQTLDDMLTLQHHQQQIQTQHTEIQMEQARLQKEWNELAAEQARLGSLRESTAQWEQAAEEWVEIHASLKAQLQNQHEQLVAAQQALADIQDLEQHRQTILTDLAEQRMATERELAELRQTTHSELETLRSEAEAEIAQERHHFQEEAEAVRQGILQESTLIQEQRQQEIERLRQEVLQELETERQSIKVWQETAETELEARRREIETWRETLQADIETERLAQPEQWGKAVAETALRFRETEMVWQARQQLLEEMEAHLRTQQKEWEKSRQAAYEALQVELDQRRDQQAAALQEQARSLDLEIEQKRQQFQSVLLLELQQFQQSLQEQRQDWQSEQRLRYTQLEEDLAHRQQATQAQQNLMRQCLEQERSLLNLHYQQELGSLHSQQEQHHLAQAKLQQNQQELERQRQLLELEQQRFEQECQGWREVQQAGLQHQIKTVQMHADGQIQLMSQECAALREQIQSRDRILTQLGDTTLVAALTQIETLNAQITHLEQVLSALQTLSDPQLDY